MFNISDYFKKFNRLEDQSMAQKQAIEKALREICGTDHASYSLKKGVLTIKGSPVFKSVVFMRRAALLEALKASLPDTPIVDIR